jgi:hypothetical protein
MNDICGHCANKKDCVDSKKRVDACGDYRKARTKKYQDTQAGRRFKRFYDAVKNATQPIHILMAGWQLLEDYRAFKYERHSEHVQKIMLEMAKEMDHAV